MSSLPSPQSSSLVRKSLYARLWLNTWRGRLLWFFGGILLACIVVWTLIRMTPPWYLPLDPSDNTVIDLSARAQNLLRYDLHTRLERVPLGEQKWTITQNEANSLLAILTAAPLDADGNRPPIDERISDPYVVFGPGTVTVCARIRDLPGGTKQGGVGTLVFSVKVQEFAGARMAQVKLISASAGRLPVPASWIEARIHSAVPAMMKAIEKMIQVQLNAKDVSMIEDALQRAGMGQPFPLQYKIDKKDVIIKDLRFEDGSFTLVLAPPVRPSDSAPATTPLPQ